MPRLGCGRYRRAQTALIEIDGEATGIGVAQVAHNLTHRKTQGKVRRLRLPRQAQFEARQSAQQHLASETGRKLYQRRAGIEGTISQGVRAFGLCQARYFGLMKTHLQHLATAAAMNLDRIVNWLHDLPHAKTRKSRFAALSTA